jgi:hypothetical protein
MYKNKFKKGRERGREQSRNYRKKKRRAPLMWRSVTTGKHRRRGYHNLVCENSTTGGEDKCSRAVTRGRERRRWAVFYPPCSD